MKTGHPLTEIAPFTWSNGHLRFDPIRRSTGRMAWQIRLASSAARAASVGHIRFHSLWGEYVLFTREGFIFAHDCLNDIVQLLQILNGKL